MVIGEVNGLAGGLIRPAHSLLFDKEVESVRRTELTSVTCLRCWVSKRGEKYEP